jgi:hypothetical protein
MNLFERKINLTALCLAGAVLIIVAQPVRAQFVPGPGYYPDMGVMGSVTAAYSSAAQQNAYMQNREMQATSTMAKSAAWQSLNRSMRNEASSRPTTVPDSAQSARDWMFQNAAPSRSSRRPMTLPATDMARATSPRQTTQPVAQKDIMIWPTFLKEQRFDGERADVEAPFRRAYADGKPLTIEDYQGVIKSVTQMKTTVKSMESQLLDTEYASVDKYLDDLIADAEKRIKARE